MRHGGLLLLRVCGVCVNMWCVCGCLLRVCVVYGIVCSGDLPCATVEFGQQIEKRHLPHHSHTTAIPQHESLLDDRVLMAHIKEAVMGLGGTWPGRGWEVRVTVPVHLPNKIALQLILNGTRGQFLNDHA